MSERCGGDISSSLGEVKDLIQGGGQPKKPSEPKLTKEPKSGGSKVTKRQLESDYWERQLDKKKPKGENAVEWERKLDSDANKIDYVWSKADKRGKLDPITFSLLMDRLAGIDKQFSLEEYRLEMGPNAPLHAGGLLAYLKRTGGFDAIG